MVLFPAHSHDRRALWIGLSFLLAAVLAMLAGILFLNGGHFTYTLDDAYIHLALAEKIRQGHYGISFQEHSAPSSSILWPFLLAPFTRLPGTDYLPFLINLVSALATVAVFRQIVGKVLLLSGGGRKSMFTALCVVLIILVTNLTGLVFTGMEHSLQVLATVLVVRGLILESETGRTDWGLALGAVAGPLIRYENLAVSAAALLFLFFRGHRRFSLSLGLAIGLAMGAFVLFLRMLDLQPLPTSVLAKAEISGLGDSLGKVFSNLARNVTIKAGLRTLAAMALALAFLAMSRTPKGERWLAASAAGAAAMHLVAGTYGWFHRYEIAHWTFLLLILLYLGRHRMSEFVAGRAWAALPLILAAGLMGLPYIRDLAKVPLAANNIFEQQYQMHRFVVDYHRGPVAVMDLGYVAYGNPNHVVDLWGLASEAALRHIRAGDTDWMGKVVASHSVGLAILYEMPGWSPPPEWIKLADLRLGRSRITPALDRVAFYAADTGAARRILPLLEEFRNTLPRGVALELRSR